MRCCGGGNLSGEDDDVKRDFELRGHPERGRHTTGIKGVQALAWAMHNKSTRALYPCLKVAPFVGKGTNSHALGKQGNHFSSKRGEKESLSDAS